MLRTFLLNALGRRAACWLALGLALVAGTKAQAQTPAWQTVNSQAFYTVTASATDASGNIYLAGSFISPVGSGDTDAFVGKWNPAINDFTWVNKYGGSKDDRALSLAIGSGGVLYIAGDFKSQSVIIGATTLYNAAPASYGYSDVFVAKLTDAGSSATTGWALKAGSYNSDSQGGLAVSGSSIYVSGTFSSTGTFGSSTITSNGNSEDAFVAKITDGGSTAGFTWALAIGGPYQEGLTKLATSGTGVYLAEQQQQYVNYNYSYLYYVHKVADAGSSGSVSWSQSAGAQAEVNALVRSGGSLYAAGTFGSLATPFGSSIGSSSGGYVVKLTDTGSGLSSV